MQKAIHRFTEYNLFVELILQGARDIHSNLSDQMCHFYAFFRKSLLKLVGATLGSIPFRIKKEACRYL